MTQQRTEVFISPIFKYHGLNFLVQGLTVLLDSGLHDNINVADAMGHIRRGDVFAWLQTLEPKRFDLSLFGVNKVYADAGTAWLEGTLALLEAYGDGHRKWGIEKRGLCLLLAWTFELMNEEITRIAEALPKTVGTAPEVH
jgi:hypothetical protein